MTSVPHGWVRTTLAEVTRSDIDHSGPIGAEEFLYVDITSVDNRAKLISAPKRILAALAPTRARQRLVPGDVLVSMTRPNLNAVAIVTEDMEGAIGSTGFHVLRADGIEPLWLYYFVQTSDFVKRISESVQGVVYPAIRPKDIERCEVPLAPLGEQRRVVAEIEKQLTRLDAGVAALERGRLNLERYRGTVLKVACEGRLVPTEAELARRQKRDYEPGDALLKRIADDRRAMWEAEELARIHAAGKVPKDDRWKSRFEEPETVDSRGLAELPEGWIWTSVEEVGLVRLGRQRSPKHQTGKHMRPYLRAANVFEGRIDVSDVFMMNFTPAEFTTYCLKEGDILLNEGQSLELVGRPAMYRGEVPGACFQNTLVRFRGSRFIVPTFALTLFRSYLRNQRFRRIARWTTNIAHLGAERFAKIEFPLPPIAEQHLIVAQVDHHLSLIDEQESFVQRAAQRAKRLRLSILRIAFGGRLVQQDPTDEPANELLKRIYSERKISSSAKTNSGKKPSPLETWERFHA